MSCDGGADQAAEQGLEPDPHADVPEADDGPPPPSRARDRRHQGDGAQPVGRIRRCIASGSCAQEAGLIRFVADPDGRIVPDLDATLPGRGTWVSAERGALDLAVKKRLFARSLKRGVTVPDDLTATVETLLLQRFLNGLGLARRAGAFVTGFETVCDTLRSGEVVLLTEAADGAADGRLKTTKLAAKAAPGSTVAAFVDAARLGASLGLDHLVHGAVRAGRHRDRALRDASRLVGFRDPWPWPEQPPEGLLLPGPGVERAA